MSEYDWLDDDDDTNDDGQRGASDAMKQLRKANKAKEQQIKELSERLESLNKSVRDRSVKDVLTAKGLPEKISAFIPANITSAEEVSAWVEEYGDVFGVVSTSSQSEQDGGQLPNPDLTALNRISQTQQSGQPFSSDPNQLSGLISSATTPEELNRILFGNSNGPAAV